LREWQVIKENIVQGVAVKEDGTLIRIIIFVYIVSFGILDKLENT